MPETTRPPEDLGTENARLSAENAQLRSEIDKLKRTIEAMREQELTMAVAQSQGRRQMPPRRD